MELFLRSFELEMKKLKNLSDSSPLLVIDFYSNLSSSSPTHDGQIHYSLLNATYYLEDF